MDLADVRDKVQGVGWVKDAKVVRMLPDTVMISVEERPALAVWQNQGRMKVIDGEGRVISEADPARFPQLPLVVGQGADQAAGLILPAVASRPRLRDRLEALVRVDDRRWDLRLKDGSLIQIPAIDQESAPTDSESSPWVARGAICATPKWWLSDLATPDCLGSPRPAGRRRRVTVRWQ